MESNTLSKYRTFIEKYYSKELTIAAQKGGRALNIDFSNVAKFDPKLSEKLLSSPKESLEFIDAAIQEFDLGEIDYKICARIFNLPDSQKIKIRDLRSEHLGLLITADGLIRQASDVRPRVTVGTFECPKCAAQLRVDQTDSKMKEPASCNQCRHKGKFKLVDKRLTDVQQLIIEEPPESLDGGEQPKRIRCILDGDLLEPSAERRRFPGNKIKVVGVVREIPINNKGGSQSTQFDIIVECNSVESSEEEFEALEINLEEEKMIKTLAKDPEIYEKLVSSIAPVIYGYEDLRAFQSAVMHF